MVINPSNGDVYFEPIDEEICNKKGCFSVEFEEVAFSYNSIHNEFEENDFCIFDYEGSNSYTFIKKKEDPSSRRWQDFANLSHRWGKKNLFKEEDFEEGEKEGVIEMWGCLYMNDHFYSSFLQTKTWEVEDLAANIKG